MQHDGAEWTQLRLGQTVDHRFHVFPLSQEDVLQDKRWTDDLQNEGLWLLPCLIIALLVSVAENRRLLLRSLLTRFALPSMC